MSQDFHPRRRFRPRGFSFPELLVTIAIMAALALIIAYGFSNFVQQGRLQAATQEVLAALADARSATLASEYGEQYGVRIESDRIIRFRGAAYDSSSPDNQVTVFHGIAVTTTLAGGPTVLFSRLTGTTTASGMIKLTQEATLASTTMTVHASGIVSVP